MSEQPSPVDVSKLEAALGGEMTPFPWTPSDRSFWSVEAALMKMAPADAHAIVTVMPAAGRLVALVRAVDALADELVSEANERTETADRYPSATGWAQDRVLLQAGARRQLDAATRLRAVVAAALNPTPHTSTEGTV